MIRAAAGAALVLAVACHAKPVCYDDCGGGPMRNPAAVHEQDRRVLLCNAAATLHAASCAPFAAVATSKLDDCSVADEMFISGYAECVTDTVCETVQACVARVDAGTVAPYDGPTSTCQDTGSHQPYGVPPADLPLAVGAADTKLGDTKSSVAHPIEVCRTPEEIGYLARVTCARTARIHSRIARRRRRRRRAHRRARAARAGVSSITSSYRAPSTRTMFTSMRTAVPPAA